MYPLNEKIKKRINLLFEEELYYECFLVNMFVIEKILFRTFKFLIIQAGFDNKRAIKLMKKFRGFNSLSENWNIFDCSNSNLKVVLNYDNDEMYNKLKSYFKIRNSLVHGSRSYSKTKMKEICQYLIDIDIIDKISKLIKEKYGFIWNKRMKVRKKSVLCQNKSK